MENESTLLGDLKAKDSSIRLQALEKIIQEGASLVIVNALLAHRKTETDPECRILTDQAVNIVRFRLDGNAAAAANFTAENVLGEFARLDVTARSLALNRLQDKARKELAPKGPELFTRENDPTVKAAILRSLGKYWPGNNLDEIYNLINSEHLSTRIAAIEILVAQNPELLIQDLPKLLVSRDPRIRALSVRGLAKIDPDEALSYLEILFDSNDSADVIAALQNSIFFPFDRVKPMFIKLIGLQNDPRIIERIGLFLEFNPDPEIPYRLWEMAESSFGEKQAAIKGLLQRTCKNIEEAGILEDKYDEYFEKLQSWIQQRGLKRWIREIIQRLEDPDSDQVELESLVRERLKNPRIREMMTKVLDLPIPEKVRESLKKWITMIELEFLASSMAMDDEPVEKKTAKPSSAKASKETVSSKAKAPATPSTTPEAKPHSGAREKAEKESISKDAPATATEAPPKKPARPPKVLPPFDDLSHEDKIRQISSWEEEDLEQVQGHLKKIFQKTDSPADILSAALRASLKFNLKDSVEVARKGSKSRDANLVSASIEYLADFDSDWLLPYIGTFLQSDNLRIKSSAFRILQKKDPAQSLALLKSMLNSKNVTQQKSCIACMDQFEFALLHGMLIQFLKTSRDNNLLEAVLALFKTNPGSENLFLLFSIEKYWEDNRLPDLAGKAKAIRLENEKTLVETGQIDKKTTEEREKAFVKRLAEEKEKASKPSAPYSVKNVAQTTESSKNTWLESLKSKFEGKSFSEILTSGIKSIMDRAKNPSS